MGTQAGAPGALAAAPPNDADVDALLTMAAEVRRLRAALTTIRDLCAETHTGQPRAYTALSRIDQITRKALT